MSKISAIRNAMDNSPSAKLRAAIGEVVDALPMGDLQKGAKYALSTENYNEHSSNALAKTAQNLRANLLSQISAKQVKDERVTNVAVESAIQGALLAAAPKEALAMKANVNQTQAGVPFAGMEGMDGAFAQRSKAFEAYNENNNTDVVKNTLQFNLLAGRQNAVGEMLYPTVVVAPDNMGVATTLRVYQVHTDIKRDISGDKQDWGRKIVISGIIDPSILKNEGTRVRPVFRAGTNEQYFSTEVAAFDDVLEGEKIKTAPLAFGKSMDVLALSQTDTLLAQGVMDRTDSLDAAVSMDKVYLKVGANVIAIPAYNHAGSNFIWTGQGNYREQKLNFDAPRFVLTADTKTIAGADLAGDLAGIVSGKLAVTFTAAFHGQVNIEEGSLKVAALDPEVLQVWDVDNDTEVTGATATALKAAIAGGEWVGFDIRAYRANANHRERGQLVDTQYYTQIWALPYRSPITALKPVNAPADTQGAELDALVTTTYIRTSSAALTNWFEVLDVLRLQQGVPHDPNAQPSLLGVSRYLLQPTLIEGKVDIPANLGNLTSFEFARDLQALLVNRIRDVAYRLYRDSRFQAVVESGAAGTTEQPTVLVFTDTMTGRYLMIDGELRTLGTELKVVVKTTPDERMQNKIGIAFGYPEQQTEGELNSLHFGNMLWSPELVSNLPISRDGQITTELTVMPRFRHICNTAVMGWLEVTGLEDAVKSRTNVNFKQIP